MHNSTFPKNTAARLEKPGCRVDLSFILAASTKELKADG
jgi:hypothetical protein